MCMCVSTCTCMCESVCVYVCMHVCVSMAMCAFVCECVPECMSVSVSICACVQVFSCPGPCWNVQGIEGLLSLSLPQPSFFHPRFVTGAAPGMRRRTLRMHGSDGHGLPSSALPQFPQLRAQSLLAQNRQILSPNPLPYKGSVPRTIAYVKPLEKPVRATHRPGLITKVGGSRQHPERKVKLSPCACILSSDGLR